MDTASQFLFIFGNTPQLSLLELQTVLTNRAPNASIVLNNEFGAIVQTTGEFDVQAVFGVLGGCTKVAEIIGDSQDPFDGVPVMAKMLKDSEADFGLSYYGSGQIQLQKIALDIKRELGGKRRFVVPREEAVLSSVIVAKQKLAEFMLFAGEDATFFFAKTVAVFDFEDWSKRDYIRPEIDPHAGMLPPRVARMMVNLALQARDSNGYHGDLSDARIILDPFCGVGTILAEAMMVGCEVIGVDKSPESVRKAKANLDWLVKEYSVSGIQYSVLVGDATKASEIVKNQKVGAIVTEPDLGPTGEITNDKLRMIKERLEKLYLDSLVDWQKVLVPGGKVVMVLPSFVAGGHLGGLNVDTKLVENIIDKAKVMGYSELTNPIAYFRPQARVRRNICMFEVKN